MAGCASQNAGTVPEGAAYASRRDAGDHKRGTVTLYPDTNGGPLPMGITAGPDGAIWFTDTAQAIVGRITTRGKYTLQMQVSGVSDGITTGPDGNLWFTGAAVASGPAIGRITPQGVVTYFPDTGGSSAEGITNGPDGALWFAESNGTVGRMTTKGKVTHFTVAPNYAFLQGIVAGPDGNLWVTWYISGSHFANQVIRLAPSGATSSFTVGSGPDFICVGPDHALWFAEADANAIGRLTTAGSYKQFSTNYEYAQPSGIARGPDGAVWFTDFSGRAGIGRMTSSGKVQYYKVPGSFPELVEIAAGPDGNMWFTSDLGPSAVGRVTVH